MSLETFEQQLRPLWLQAQTGDEQAYRDALGLVAARLRAYLRRRLQAWPEDLEDLVQETLLALHLQRGTYDSALPVSAWVFAIARHKLMDLWRRRGRHAQWHTSLNEIDEDMLPATDDAGAAPARRDLAVLLEALPVAQRQAIVLTKVEGLSVAEASARTGVSVSALKVQVHRGLKKLAALMRRDAE